MIAKMFLICFLVVTTVAFASESLPTALTKLKPRALAPRTDECQLCHIKRVSREIFIPKKNATELEHFEINISHGSLKKNCNDCHDVNNSNKLVSPGTFENTSLLCSRCHSDQYVRWQNGSHGKKMGSWTEDGVYLHCIDCHNPHAVSFKPMEARPAPKPLAHGEH